MLIVEDNGSDTQESECRKKIQTKMYVIRLYVAAQIALTSIKRKLRGLQLF